MRAATMLSGMAALMAQSRHPSRQFKTKEDTMTSAKPSAKPAAEPLIPVELGAGRIKFAQGMKAGRWVFANGLMAQDFVHGIAPDVLAARLPHGGRAQGGKEGRRGLPKHHPAAPAAGPR